MTDFSHALISLKHGKRVAREGWNGKGMWLKLVPSGHYMVQQTLTPPPMGKYSTDDLLEEFDFDLLPWIGIKTADDNFGPWLASQTDILAEDWVEIE
jgi:hypothetical protein